MSEESPSKQNVKLDFDPILPESGILFFEECPTEYEIERPKLLPLKSSTHIRFEKLQHEASRQWKERQKTAKKTAEN